MLSGPVADRVGRKLVIILCTLFFGLFSLFTVFAHNTGTLLLMRFLTGLGLGGSMPNIIALTAEYMPLRIRKTMISVMFSGVPVGAVVGGLIASDMIPAYGWESMFYLGGIVPLVLGLILCAALPESARFLVTMGKSGSQDKVRRILRRIGVAAGPQTTVVLAEQRLTGMPVRRLFDPGYARNTSLLWVVFFLNILIIYFVSNWLPTVLRNAGLPLSMAVIGVVALQGGGVVGAILLGRWCDAGPVRRVLGISFVLAAVTLGLIGYMHGVAATMLMIFAAGFFVIGAQNSLNALAASVYPTSVRSTGVSWA
ncbi:MAG: MFS transporter, partial [Alicyclobacillus sp.]|nr:MFS transporter [Alicyclobacillus sp.]